jgi:hypothetical protein
VGLAVCHDGSAAEKICGELFTFAHLAEYRATL